MSAKTLITRKIYVIICVEVCQTVYLIHAIIFSCWAFVEACRVHTPPPSEAPVSDTPTLSPITDAPSKDPSSPTTPEPTLHPTDIYDLLEQQSKMFYCAATWDGIICGTSIPCPDGSNR